LALDSKSASGNPLGLLRDLCKNCVKYLHGFDNTKQEQAQRGSEAFKTLTELADWVALNWIQMAELVKVNRAVFDLCKQQQHGGEEGADVQSADSQLIALHKVIEESRGGLSGLESQG